MIAHKPIGVRPSDAGCALGYAGGVVKGNRWGVVAMRAMGISVPKAPYQQRFDQQPPAARRAEPDAVAVLGEPE